MVRDYDGGMGKYQAELDAAGIDFDITNLCGATKREIEGFVSNLISVSERYRGEKKCGA